MKKTNPRVLFFVIGSLLLPLGCGGDDPTDLDGPMVLPSIRCEVGSTCV